MTDFYLAGSWAHREQCLEVAGRIAEELGWTCDSSWLTSERDDEDPDERTAGAADCLAEIDRVDAVVVLVGDRPSLGKHVELGAALGLRKTIYLVWAPWGALANIHRCAFYGLCEGPWTLDGFLAKMKEGS